MVGHSIASPAIQEHNSAFPKRPGTLRPTGPKRTGREAHSPATALNIGSVKGSYLLIGATLGIAGQAEDVRRAHLVRDSGSLATARQNHTLGANGISFTRFRTRALVGGAVGAIRRLGSLRVAQPVRRYPDRTWGQRAQIQSNFGVACGEMEYDSWE